MAAQAEVGFTRMSCQFATLLPHVHCIERLQQYADMRVQLRLCKLDGIRDQGCPRDIALTDRLLDVIM